MVTSDLHYFIGLVMVLAGVVISTAGSLSLGKASFGPISAGSIAFLAGLAICLFASWYLGVVLRGGRPSLSALISDISSIFRRRKG